MPIPPAAIPSSFSDLAKRFSESLALLAALMYVLGVLRITGELRTLHLSAPTVLAGFAHTDVLMKGVGVLASQMTSTVIMLGALVLFGSRTALDGLNRVLLDTRTLRIWELVLVSAAGAGIVLASRYWEGAAYALVTLAILAVCELRNRPLTRAAALGIAVLGVLFMGLIGSYFHTPPLMHATAVRADDTLVEGLLVGKGTDGEWYIAVGEPDDYELEVIGGATEKALKVSITPANDEGYRTLYFQIVDGWL